MKRGGQKKEREGGWREVDKRKKEKGDEERWIKEGKKREMSREGE